MLVDNVGKPIASDRVVPLEVTPVHMPDLISAHPGILCPDFLDIFQSKGLPGHTGKNL
jgi:hypothetical protein